jgi:putative transcriptional regulator
MIKRNCFCLFRDEPKGVETDMPKRTKIGREVERALREVVARRRGEIELTIRIAPDAVDVAAIRKRTGLSRAAFAATFGLDQRALQEWEQRRRQPDRAARVLLAVIKHNPKAVMKALETEAA